MKALLVYLLLVTNFSEAQESITCAKNSDIPTCSTSENTIYQPSISIPKISRITVKKDSGTSVSFQTDVESNPHTYWIDLEQEEPVTFQGNLSSKLSNPNSFDSPRNASSLILTGGILNSVNLDLSGYKGKSAKDFSYKCAEDVLSGKFGAAALNNFNSRRVDDPNLPVDQCDNTDLVWISENERDTFCPDNSTDSNQDNILNPIYNLRRLSYKNKCLYQEDVRSCRFKGQARKCRSTYEQVVRWECDANLRSECIFFKPQEVKYLLDPVTEAISSKHNLSVVSSTAKLTQYEERSYQVWKRTVVLEFDDSLFYYDPAVRSESNAFNAFCESNYNFTNSTLQFYQSEHDSRTPGFWFDPKTYQPLTFDQDEEGERDGSGPYIVIPQKFTPAVYHLSPSNEVNFTQTTTNQRCSLYAANLAGRNILEIVSEASLVSNRTYEYFVGACPSNWSLASTDQLHLKYEWSEEFSCTIGNCPNTNLVQRESTHAKLTATLEQGQPGAESGVTHILAYDVKSAVLTSTPGQDGKTGRLNLTIPSTIKYCTNIRDLNTTSNETITARRPEVDLFKILFKPYQVSLPATTPITNYQQPKHQIYKRLDSSVRYWLSRSTEN